MTEIELSYFFILLQLFIKKSQSIFLCIIFYFCFDLWNRFSKNYEYINILHIFNTIMNNVVIDKNYILIFQLFFFFNQILMFQILINIWNIFVEKNNKNYKNYMYVFILQLFIFFFLSDSVFEVFLWRIK